MSAAPLPVEPPQPESPEADGWALLDGLRRKLDDQVAQQRKTATQVGQLAESIGALVEAQRKRSRWLNLNSFVAYVMFTVLCSIAFYFVYAAHARELAAARDRAVAERDAAVARADEAVGKLTRREAADAAAAKQGEAATRAADTLRAHQDEVVQAAIAAIKDGRYREVVAPVERALGEHPDGPRAPQLHYLAGVARAKTGDFDAAIEQLKAAVDSDASDDDVRFQLASALDHAGQFAKARAEYDRFATARPQSPFAVFATRRSAAIARLAAPSAAAPAPTGEEPAAGAAAAGTPTP